VAVTVRNQDARVPPLDRDARVRLAAPIVASLSHLDDLRAFAAMAEQRLD